MISRDDQAWNHSTGVLHPAGFAERPARARRGRRLRSLAQHALPLVAVLWLCGWVSMALGQEQRTLVSNTGQTASAGSSPIFALQSYGMQFTTGSSATSWTLASIQLDVNARTSGVTPTVSLYGASGQLPTSRIATLTNPDRGTGLKSFAAPTGSTVTLQASTTYTILVESASFSFNGFSLKHTTNAAEDSGGAAGWQISDARLSKSGGTWSVSTSNLKLRLAVLGTPDSSDATLSALTLADSDGVAIGLDPAFAAGTTGYTAEVGHTVSTVTVTADTAFSGDTVVITNDDDTTSPATADLALVVGANTVTVTVTAPGTTTTKTYTVSITRAPAPPDPTLVPHALVSNVGQTTASGATPVLDIQSVAMQFSTGDSANRWSLESIRLEVHGWQSSVTPSVSLHQASGQQPGTSIATLTNPASGTGSKAFSVPSGQGIRLQANTTYTVVIEVASSIFNGFTLSRTDNSAEDAGGASGWEISDSMLTNPGTGWIVSTSGKKLQFAVVGTVVSDDATLSALALEDADSVAIDLQPAFEAGTTEYTASVANSVSAITVTAATSHTEATLSIADDDDDATPGTAELSLDVGENTVSVTVTAEDGVATATYTATVTRAPAVQAPATPGSQTLISNLGQTPHSSLELHKEQRRAGIQFRTGDSATAWTLSAIQLQVTTWHPGVAPTVKLRRQTDQWPGTIIATLQNPSPGTGSKAFAAPAGLKLEPDTTYSVVAAAGVRQGRFNLGTTRSNDDDSGGAAGWRIGNRSQVDQSGSWSEIRPSLSVAVQGAAVPDGEAPGGLTGWFALRPREHDGSGEFTLRLGFSDAIDASRRAMREHAVQVSGGQVTSATRVQQRRDLWDVKIRPTGLDAVTVTLEGGSACSSAAEVCTADGRSLAAALTLTVPGPLALAVADAEAREGVNPAVVFTVSLTRASTRSVTVDYATTDGTASAGEDYTATSGTLTFEAGTVEQTVSVPVLDDASDEGEETFTLTLSNPTGAILADAEATGTIANSDTMPMAWIARFGRTLAAQTVDAIGHRFEGVNRSRIVVGGMALDSMGTAVHVPRNRESMRNAGFANADRHRNAAVGRGVEARELLLGSEFQLNSGDGDGAPAWTAWGRIAAQGFEATQDDVALEGDVTTTFLGADFTAASWVAGLAISVSGAEGSFELFNDDSSVDKGEIESRLAGFYPYVGFSPTEQLHVWALVGYGTGDLTLTELAGANGQRPQDVKKETDLSMRMGAIGAKGKVLSAGESGGIDIALKSDAFWVRMKSDAVESATVGRMEAATGDATRLRLTLEGSREFAADSGGTFTPSAEVGLRQDGGDAETGAGMEIGARLRYTRPGVTLEGAVRGLVAHESSDYEEWGASAAVRIDPGDAGEGLSLAAAPAIGAPTSGVERLWLLSDAGSLAPEGDFRARRRFEAELGYGFRPAGTIGVVTPYTGVSIANGGSRTYRTGARWVLGSDATLWLEAGHDVGSGNDASASSVTLRTELRW